MFADRVMQFVLIHMRSHYIPITFSKTATGQAASVDCFFARSHLHESCYGQVGAAGLFGQVLVLPEDVLRHRLHQGLHPDQVGREEALRPRQLQERDETSQSLPR